MSDFNAKMHQNRFWLGTPLWSLQYSPDPLAVLRGLLLRRGEEMEGEREGDPDPDWESEKVATLCVV